MVNPILEALRGRTPQIPNNVIQTFKALKNSDNPNQFIQNLMQTNPQFKQVMQLVQSSDKSPKDLFYELAQQKGVNPEQVLEMLK